MLVNDLGCVQCPYNITKSDDERRECSKYSIRLCNGQSMQIPPEQDDVNLYSSYGPKVNHQFYNFTVCPCTAIRVTSYLHFFVAFLSYVLCPFQTIYSCVDHPRFGLVMGVFLSSGNELRRGQEVFINYGYSENNFPYDFPWYWAMKKHADNEIGMVKKGVGEDLRRS